MTTNTITQITSDSEEVRVSDQTRTFVFHRKGFHIATGGGVSLEDLLNVLNQLRLHPLTKRDKIIVNLTVDMHREHIKQIV